MPVDDLIIDGPVAAVSMDRPQAIELDPSLTRELTNCKFSCYSLNFSVVDPYVLPQYFSPTVTLLDWSYTSRHLLHL